MPMDREVVQVCNSGRWYHRWIGKNCVLRVKIGMQKILKLSLKLKIVDATHLKKQLFPQVISNVY